jgi:hypothetical protein
MSLFSSHLVLFLAGVAAGVWLVPLVLGIIGGIRKS